MSLHALLKTMVQGMPPGSSITLPTDWLVRQLEEADKRPGSTDDLLTVEDVAERLGRAASTVRGWCGQGVLEGAFRLRGKSWRIPESSFHAFLQKQAPKGEADPPAEDEIDVGRWRRHRRTAK